MTGAVRSSTAVAEAILEPAPVQGLAALFDDGLDVPGRGDLLPPLWHWVALPAWPVASLTGPDGHPLTGGFLPDVGKPRRMFAGGRVDFLAPLRVGSMVRREDRVLSVTPKSGRQGEFVLVQVETRILDEEQRLALVEVQDIIYRDAPPPVEDPAPRATAAQAVVPALVTEVRGSWRFCSDPTKLFRFSAVTGNAHRIHYDHPYATGMEGYPGLVVHGPLMTLALAEVVRLSSRGPVRTLVHRNVRPLFCGEEAEIVREQSDHSWELGLQRDGTTRSTLAVEVGPTDV